MKIPHVKSFTGIALFALTSTISEADNRGTFPLPDFANDLYPYNTVGVVTNDSGWMGSGCAIGQQTVVTAAHVFYDDDLHEWTAAPYDWTWKSKPTSKDEDAMNARSWIHFDDYALLADQAENGSASGEAFNKDVFILRFEENIIDTPPAKWAQDLMTTGSYKMIVGYPSGYYDFWDLNRERMHATCNGEPIEAAFTDYFEGETSAPTEKRLFTGYGLNSTSGNSGGPLFVFLEGGWIYSGIYVGGNSVVGSSIVVGIDTIVAEMCQAAIDGEIQKAEEKSPESENTDYLYIASRDDLNGTVNKPEDMFLNVVKIHTIYPVNDEDFFKVPVFESFDSVPTLFFHSATVDSATVTLYDENMGSLASQSLDPGYFVTILVQDYPTTRYVKVNGLPNSSKGKYSIGIVDSNINSFTHIDAGAYQSSVFELPLNDTVNAQLTFTQPNDFYTVNITEPGRLVVESDGDLNTFALLGKINSTAQAPYTFNDFTEIIDVDTNSSDSGDFQIEADLSAGTYTLLVESDFTEERGFYSLTSKFIPEKLGSVLDDEEYNDLFKFADFSRMLTYEESISPAGDVDIRGIHLSNAGNLNIDIQTALALEFRLFNENYEEILITDLVTQTATGYQFGRLFKEGNYFLRIKSSQPGAVGDYNISFNFQLHEGFWHDFQGAADGEKALDWFGTFTSGSTTAGWIHHQFHGDIYIKGMTTNNFWIWDPVIGLWFKTSDSLYPNLFDPAQNRTYRYLSGSINPRNFEVIETGEILTESQLLAD